MNDLEAARRHLKEQARKNRERAESARTPALREYYRGRADGAQAAADAFSKLTYDPADNPYSSTHKTD